MTPRLPRHGRRSSGGFTIAEMMVTAAAFLGISGGALILSRTTLQREEINAVSVGLSGWLETVQRGAQRTTSGCTVTFRTGAALTAGSVLASVSPTSCINETSFLINSLSANTTLSSAISSNPTSTVVTFTPRGTVTLVNDMTLTLRPSSSSLTRCLRIAGTSGFLAMGSNNSGGDCSAASFGESI